MHISVAQNMKVEIQMQALRKKKQFKYVRNNIRVPKCREDKGNLDLKTGPVIFFFVYDFTHMRHWNEVNVKTKVIWVY